MTGVFCCGDPFACGYAFFPYTLSNVSSSPSMSIVPLTSKRSCTLPSVRSIRLFHNAAFGSSISETSTRPTTRYFICTSCGLFFNTFAWSLLTMDIISGTVMLLTSSRIAFQLSPSFGLPVGFPLCPGFHALGGIFALLAVVTACSCNPETMPHMSSRLAWAGKCAPGLLLAWRMPVPTRKG